MNAARRPLPPRWTIGLVVLVAVSGLLLFPVTADEIKLPGSGNPPAPNDKQVENLSFTLKYASAREAAPLLQELFAERGSSPTIKIVAYDSRNTLLISAPPADLNRIKQALQTIDVPRTEQEASQLELRTYDLHVLEPDKSLEDALRLVFRPGRPGNFALDKTRKVIVAQADNATLKELEALLVRLEDTVTRRPGPDVQVRIVWLVNGPVHEDIGQPPADLKDVLPGLAKYGIDQPRLAAQTVVNVTTNTQFQAKGVTKLAVPCQLAVTGRLSDKKELAGLEITIRATREAGQVEICNLQTEISAPLGHLVVLGVTPADNVASAFVVQVLPNVKQPPK